MNEARLAPCRTCGKEISTNLAKRRSYMRVSESVGCPHCGEADPHLTEEEVEIIIEQKKIDGKLYEEQRLKLLEEQKKGDFWAKLTMWSCLSPFILIAVVIVVVIIWAIVTS